MKISTKRNNQYINGQYKTRTASATDCRLGIKYGLGIKRGLEKMDWV